MHVQSQQSNLLQYFLQVFNNNYFNNNKLTKTVTFLLRNEKSINHKTINYSFPEENKSLLLSYLPGKLKFYIDYSLVPVALFAATSKKEQTCMMYLHRA